MNMRVDENGEKISEGEQIQIGGNEAYISTCREHFKAGVSQKTQRKEREAEELL